MNEWTVVTALSVVAGLVAAVAGPIVKLNGTISRLSILEHVLVRLDKLEQEDERARGREEKTERRLSQRMDSQDQRLCRCENRLSLLEQRQGGRV